ncbi:MAG: hypothetical protein H9W81_12390 [Enterococcus sp.]|nr:hypothetical protein [Enterococcus sp.]
MMIEELVIRGISALLIINVFSLGLYMLVRGYYKHKSFSKMRKVNGHVITIHKWFRASVAWYWRGQEFMATDPALFALRKRERVPLFISEDGVRFHLNIWTHNGIGLAIAGSILCLSALLLVLVFV